MHKLYFIFVLFIIGCGTPKSQLKGHCKLKVDKIDDFTNERILETRAEALIGGLVNTLYFYVRMRNENTFLHLNISTASIKAIHEGDEIIFLFNNGGKLALTYPEYQVSNYSHVDGLGSLWNINTYFPLTLKDIELLKYNTIKKVKVEFSDSYLENDVKDLRQDNIAGLLKCIQAYGH